MRCNDAVLTNRKGRGSLTNQSLQLVARDGVLERLLRRAAARVFRPMSAAPAAAFAPVLQLALVIACTAPIAHAAAVPNPVATQDPGLLFRYSADHGLAADFARGEAQSNFADKVKVIADGKVGPALQAAGDEVRSRSTSLRNWLMVPALTGALPVSAEDHLLETVRVSARSGLCRHAMLHAQVLEQRRSCPIERARTRSP